MNRDPDRPRSEEEGDDGTSVGDGSPIDEEDGASGQLDLPLDALLDWGKDPAKLDEELEKVLEAQSAEAILTAERDEYLDALKRLQADFDNFRKRSLRQQTELLERATEGLCIRLLPVLDALDLATAHLKAQGETNEEATAIGQIDSLLRDILAHEGIDKIDAVGVLFDPTIHDAVGHMPSEPGTGPQSDDATGDDLPADKDERHAQAGPAPRHASKVAQKADKAPPEPSGPVVAQVMRPGYRMKAKVLRPAMVLVRD